MRWLAAAAAVMVLESLASAQPHERAALATLDLADSAPRYLVARATTQIEQGLAATGYDVRPTVPLPSNLAHCRTSDCMREIGRVLGVQAILVAAVAPRGESSVISLRLFDAATGRELAALTELCDLCGESELIEQLGIATSAVRARAAEARAHPIGEAPSIVPGVVIGAVGVAALATGIYLVAIDGTCGDPMPGHSCDGVRRTLTPGIVGISVGAAAVVLGTVLVVRAHNHTFNVSPTGNGATVGMTFTF